MQTTLLSNGAILVAQLALFVWWLGTCSRGQRVAYPALILVGLGIALGGAILLPVEFHTQNVPLLHEGNSGRAIAALLGTIQAGDNLHDIWRWAAAGDVPIVGAIRANTVATIMALATVSVLAHAWLRLHPIWVLAILAYLNYRVPFVNACVVGDLPSGLIGFYSAMMILPLHLTRAAEGRRIRLLAAGALLLTAFALLRTRPETLLLAGPVALMGSLQAARVSRPMVWVDQGASRFLAFLRRKPAVLVVLAFLPGAVVAWTGLVDEMSYARWIVAALDPLRPTFLSAPGELARWIAPGAVILIVAGWWYCLKRWAQFGALAIFIIPTYRLYHSASHGVYWELFRYLSHLWLPLLILGLAGWAQIRVATEAAGWSSAVKRLALAALFVGLFPLHATPWDSRHEAAYVEHQEAQFLVDALVEYPECVFVSPVRHRQSESTLLFDASGELQAYQQTDRAIRTAFGQATCVLYYRSLSCNLVSESGCPDRLEGVVVASQEATGSRYSDVPEYGALPTVNQLEIIRLQLEAAPNHSP